MFCGAHPNSNPICFCVNQIVSSSSQTSSCGIPASSNFTTSPASTAAFFCFFGFFILTSLPV